MTALEDSIRHALEEAKSGRTQEAMAVLRTVLDEAPEQPDANWIMGSLLAASGRLPAGIQHLERAVRSAPENPQMVYQLGAMYGAAGQIGPSIEMMQRAVTLAPSWHIALNGLATAMYSAGQYDQADDLFRRSIAAKPDQVEAAMGLAGLLMAGGRPQEAIKLFRKAAERFPGNTEVLAKLASALSYAMDAEPQELLMAHLYWGQTMMAQVPEAEQKAVFENSRDPERVLRVGFLSADLYDHSVAYFLRPILEGRDPARIQTIIYNASPWADGMTATLKSAADVWHDYAGRKEEEVATLIRTDGPDVVIDLSGLSNLVLILRRRCAPVQATYLGYPSTTGLPTIDYRIVDHITDTPDSDALNSEKLIRLDGCFLCYAPPQNAPEPGALPCLGEVAQKAGEGWDAGWFGPSLPITFGSFNSIRKLSPATIDLWSKVLHGVPGSRLLLKTRGMGTQYAQRHITDQFGAKGIDPQRIGMVETVESKVEHWGWYRGVDIALDTTPYNGVTTTCEALWMGVPVVTLQTQLHAGRVGSSLLKAAGLERCIARTPQQFVQIAVSLAEDRTALAKLRAGLRRQMAASDLCNGQAHARRFEGALRQMWRNWCSGTQA